MVPFRPSLTATTIESILTKQTNSFRGKWCSIYFRSFEEILRASCFFFLIKRLYALSSFFGCRTWGTEENDTDYAYYMEFIDLVVNISTENLGKFGKFADDERFTDIDMLELARELHPNYDDAITSFDKGAEVNFVEVITERGICYTINSPLSVLLSTM